MLVCRGQAGLLADDDDEVEDIAPIVMEDFGEEEHDARLSSVVKVSNPLTPFCLLLADPNRWHGFC